MKQFMESGSLCLACLANSLSSTIYSTLQPDILRYLEVNCNNTSVSRSYNT